MRTFTEKWRQDAVDEMVDGFRKIIEGRVQEVEANLPSGNRQERRFVKKKVEKAKRRGRILLKKMAMLARDRVADFTLDGLEDQKKYTFYDLAVYGLDEDMDDP
jgi:hypothetical protein